jgi:cellulose biosynthesis protein BcsQ
MDDNAVKLKEKLERYRATVKNLYKEEFWDKIKPYQDIIKNYSERKGLDILPATLQLASKETDPTHTVMFIAGAVELIDPSHEKKSV